MSLKKLTLAAITILIVAGSARAQYGWQWQNPLGQGNTLSCVQMLDANTALAFGGSDAVLRTTDGGTTWVRLRSGVHGVLQGGAFLNIASGMIVGNHTLLQTHDSGQTWTSHPTTANLNSIAMFPDNNATTIGDSGVILHSTSSGSVWANQNSHTSQTLNAICFSNASTGVIAGDSGIVLLTFNGGTNWISLYTSTTLPLLGITMAGNDTIIAVGANGVILRSTNLGSTWAKPASGTLDTLTAVTIVNGTFGTAVGYHGTVLHTTNAGATWTAQTSSTNANLFSVSCVAATLGMIVGGHGTILQTINSGATWNTLTSGFTNNLTSVAVLDSESLVAVGANASVFRTSNNGANWNTVATGGTTVNRAVTFANAMNGWIAGDTGAISKSTDGGRSWSVQNSRTKKTLYAVSFNTVLHGIAVGDSSVITTTDGGLTWLAKTVPYLLLGVATLDSLDAVAVGVNHNAAAIAIILRTNDGGNSWQTVDSMRGDSMIGISFSDGHNGMTIGTNYFERTTDGGFTWQATEISTGMNAVGMCDSLHAFISGSTIMHTTDAGATWVSQPSGTANILRSIAVRGQRFATIVGDSGTILSTTTAGFDSPLLVSTDNFVFDSLLLNDVAFKTFTVQNNSLSVLTLTPKIIGDTDFFAGPDTLVMQPGQRSTITVRFHDLKIGLRSAIIALNRTGTGFTDSVGVQGIGVAPALPGGFDKTFIDFGGVMLSATDTVDQQYYNTLNTTLIVQMDSLHDPRFVITPLRDTIAPGQMGVFHVLYTPTDTIAANSFAFFSVQGLPQVLTLGLRGHGVPYDISFRSKSLDFGNVRVKTFSTLNIVGVNTSSDSFAIAAVISSDSHFTLQPTSSIPKNDTGIITVIFIPDSVGTFDAWILIYHTLSSLPDSVHVTGKGIPATSVRDNGMLPATLSVATFPNPLTLRGENATLVFTLPGPGGITLNLYSSLGEKISSLAAGTFDAGSHLIQFNTGMLQPGIYFYRLITNAGMASGKLTVY